MLFNSLQFLVFLPIAFAGYWACADRPRIQNLWVVVASYVFYGWWDWRFLILIAFTSGWAYLFGLLPRSKWNVAISLVINLGILGFFKYFNFFVDSLVVIIPGLAYSACSLNIVLPVGISFYTFQALSYTIDVYRGTIKPTRDPIAFFAFISFFPQLVAGPIERATNLLPQFLQPRHFDYSLAVEGCWQMLWGFFKKICVADACAVVANMTLGADNPSSLSLTVGLVSFAFQIYGDFSGYSDIAIGCSKLFGIRLMRNFTCPYFARDIAEFWRRWHISLTTWFRDYLYIPLGGSRCGTAKKIRNTFVIFLISGLWHGANWTFVAWGAFHACCFLPLLLARKNRKHLDGGMRLMDIPKMILTFAVVVIGWAFFRANTICQAFAWLEKVLLGFDFHLRQACMGSAHTIVIPILIMLGWEWVSKGREVPVLPRWRWLRWVVYYMLVFAIVYWQPAAQEFIYFQF